MTALQNYQHKIDSDPVQITSGVATFLTERFQ